MNMRIFHQNIVLICLIILIGAILFLLAVSSNCKAAVWVNGYFRSDGTWVNGHYRSEPNALKYDNYSWREGDGLYNKTYFYSTRNYNINWYTPSYLWDKDYYLGKYYYELNHNSYHHNYNSYKWHSFDSYRYNTYRYNHYLFDYDYYDYDLYGYNLYNSLWRYYDWSYWNY